MPFPTDAPEKVHAKVASGFLPIELPKRMWAGRGVGKPCDGCDEVIQPLQVEYEMELVDGRIVRLHLGCAGLLEAERRLHGKTP